MYLLYVQYSRLDTTQPELALMYDHGISGFIISQMERMKVHDD